MKVQGAVKKETAFVAAGTGIGTGVMILVFFILHRLFPEAVPFGIREVISGLIGWLAATLNFFLMGVSVQKVAAQENEDNARRTMTLSYRYRTMLQVGWALLALVVPIFNGAAGIIPMFIPSFLIKARAMTYGKKLRNEKEVKALDHESDI